MSSNFVLRLLDQLKKTENERIQALDEAIASATLNSDLSDEDRLQARQLLFAIEVIDAISKDMSPWVAKGPTERDKDWATAVYKAAKAGSVRPPHFDAEIEELVQHITH